LALSISSIRLKRPASLPALPEVADLVEEHLLSNEPNKLTVKKPNYIYIGQRITISTD